MQKILIINRLGIGDVVLTTPLAQILKKYIKNVKIGFLVAKKAEDILKNHPYIDDVFVYKNKHEKKKVIDDIRAKEYKAAIIVDGRLGSSFIAWRAKCKLLNSAYTFSINKKQIFGRKELAKKAIEDFSMYAKTIFDINYDENLLIPKIGSCDINRKIFIEKWIEKIKKDTKEIVLIVARTAADIKNWNKEELSKLNLYLNENGIKPVYIGSKNDREYIESISGTKFNIAGDFGLRDIPEFASYASWALSMCTGPLHILGTVENLPIIAIYGPSDPLRWAPKNAIVVQSSLPCVPCLNWAKCKREKGNTCMDEIKFERVKNILLKYALIK